MLCGWKRIQCLSNASQHVPIYLQPFPSNSTRSLSSIKFAILSHFWHILASPVYAPGTIAVKVTWMERGFNACKVPRCIYPSIFNHFWDLRYSDISVASTGRKLRHFHIPPLFSGPAGVTPSEFREDLDIHKTRMNGLSCGEESM